MYDYLDSPLSRLRFFAAAMLIFAGILVLPVLLNALWIKPTVSAANINQGGSQSTSSGMEDSPNVITSGVFNAADGISKATSSVSKSLNNGVETTAQSVSTAAAQSGKFIANGTTHSTAVVGRGIGGGFGLMAKGIGGSAKFAVSTTSHVFGIVAHPPTVGSVIKPADSTKVPTIGDGSSTLPPDTGTLQKQAAAQTPAPPAADTSAQWPIHGTITTEFGASDWPYQRYHTGIDISDGHRSGITPIRPFKPGRVVQVIHSGVGLGNHVIVDNGGGVTSVYGHMFSTSVQVGQQVDKNSVLGLEGTTGASTGPHVHFEIYLNGVLQNPHNYVPGRP